MHFVFGVIGDGIRHRDREAKAHYRIAGLQRARAAVLWSCRREPGIHGIVDEGVVEPLLHFMAKSMNVLEVRDGIARIAAEYTCVTEPTCTCSPAAYRYRSVR
jgi:hypothetical protein